MNIVSTICSAIFWVSALLLIYVYLGYGMLLDVLVRLRSDADPRSELNTDDVPFVTVLLTVHNEERLIEARLANLLAQDYPSSRLEILVASDGSTDRTDALVAGAKGDGRVRLIRTARLGKSSAQNIAALAAMGDIIVLTDAETRFEMSCISNMVGAFADRSVGCVTAELRFSEREGVVGRGQQRYWAYELALRRYESMLGILAVASGQAMAVRRALWRDLPSFVGDDCVVPLDVIAQGHKVLHCSSAWAYDEMPSEHGAEFTARVRMTARNWTGTWLYPSLLNPLRYPGYALSLWSHKVLRWGGSVALVAMAAAAVGLAVVPVQLPAVTAFVAFLLSGLLGYWGSRRGRAIPVAGMIYGFLLANVGFLVGIVKALTGQRIVAYSATNTDQSDEPALF